MIEERHDWKYYTGNALITCACAMFAALLVIGLVSALQ